MTKYIHITLAVLAASLVLAACGSSSNGPQRTGSVAGGVSTSLGTPGSASVDAAIGDCSKSFHSQMPQFIGDMDSVAVDAAKKEHRFIAACFDGSPLRNLHWDPNADFGAKPQGIPPDDLARVNYARALGLAPKLAHMIQTTRERTPGSGQLELLEVLAQTPGLGRAYVFSDLIINEVDGLNLAKATKADIDQTAKRWLPRLGSGLKHVQIVFVGVGRHAPASDQVRAAEALFRDLITRAGGSFLASPDLPQLGA